MRSVCYGDVTFTQVSLLARTSVVSTIALDLINFDLILQVLMENKFLSQIILLPIYQAVGMLLPEITQDPWNI